LLETLEITSKKVLLLAQLWGRYFRKPQELFEKVSSGPKTSLKSSISHHVISRHFEPLTSYHS